MQNNQTDPPNNKYDHGPNNLGEKLLESSDLLEGSKEVLIKHGDEIYRLRQTRNGKLILHK